MNGRAERWRRTISGERTGLGPALARRGLWLAQWPYRLGVWWRNKLFDMEWKRSHRAPKPVVSVGNLSVGGTGKTPCVEYVARFYVEHAYRVAILSRGYGTEHGLNDEGLLLSENLHDVPLYQDPDRVELARVACEESEPDVLVLDDGFQHRRLARDLDIVLIDATDPCDNRYLLPRGTLREPMKSLKRAHAVILTHGDQLDVAALGSLKTRVRQDLDAGLIAVSRHKPLGLAGTERRVAPLETLNEHPVAGFCGIGNPIAFRRTLEQLGASVVDFRIFPDHHDYTREDVDELRTWAGRLPADAVVATTQKDFVKLDVPELGGRPLWAVRIGLDFLEGEETLERLLLDEIRE